MAARPATRTVEVSVRVRPDAETSAIPGWVQSNTSFASKVVTGSDQGIAFRALGDGLLTRLREGFSCTLLAYGQTGSGKTYTMFGPTGCLTETALAAAGDNGTPDAWGIFPRVALALLRSSERSGSMQASAIEVYNNVAYDLLNGGAPLQVSRTKPKSHVIVRGGGCELGARDGTHSGGDDFAHPSTCQCRRCFKAKSEAKKARKAARARAGQRAAAGAGRLPNISRRRRGAPPARAAGRAVAGSSAGSAAFATIGESLWKLETPSDVARLAMKVEASRRAAGHRLNDRSSRSHCLVRLHVTQLGQGRGSLREKVVRRQFLFVDLAGSERTLKSGAGGERLVEAKQINSSLTVLGRVIRALGSGTAHVPWRDSTLTMLLRGSFDDRSAGAGACASVVVCAAPGAAHRDETVCSLRFGGRMAKVSNRVVAAVASDADEEKRALQAQADALRARLRAMADAGMAGGFAAGAVPSEVKSLEANRLRWESAKRRLDEIQKRHAEASTTTSGKYDRRRGPREAPRASAGPRELEQRLADAVQEERVAREILGRQRTIKRLWTEPKPTYAAAEAELRQIEARIGQLGP
jgi:uncharacterized protein YggU (UPF0235/DUF167 family)